MAVAVGCRREQGGGNGVKQRGCNCSIQQQHWLNVFEIHVELRQIQKKKKIITCTFLVSSASTCPAPKQWASAPLAFFTCTCGETACCLSVPACTSFCAFVFLVLPQHTFVAHLYLSWIIQSLSIYYLMARSERGLWCSQRLYYSILSPSSALG